MKILLKLFLLTLIFLQIFSFPVQAKGLKYGVFIGLAPSKINKLIGYNEVVIDASYYTKDQITYLHKNGVKVYSYLNIGSIESFRSYYKNFSSITLGNYDNWPDEKWIDVSNAKWQSYIVNVLAKQLKDKGVDGFFLDNLDVYSQYGMDPIFNGIRTILKDLNDKYKSPIIVNGGYEFFIKAISKKIKVNTLVYGINTESVYTTVNFSKNTFVVNPSTDRNYAIEYLNDLKSKGLHIYIIEYSKNSSVINRVNTFYKNTPFACYISKI